MVGEYDFHKSNWLVDGTMTKKNAHPEGSYAEYFMTTKSPKLKKLINVKDLINQEVEERNALR